MLVEILNPIAWLYVFILVYRAAFTLPSGSVSTGGFTNSSYIVYYLLIGTLVFYIFSRLLWTAGLSFQQERWTGTFEHLLLTPAPRSTILLGSSFASLLEIVPWTVCLVVIVWIGFGGPYNAILSPFMILMIPAIAIAATSLTVLFSSLFVWTRSAWGIASTLQHPLRFLSGATFPIDALPEFARILGYGIVLTYAITGMRKVLLEGAGLEAAWTDLAMLFILALVNFALGSLMLRLAEKSAKKTGSLGFY